MTDRRARLVALAMFFVSWTCVGLNCRMAVADSTPLSRIAGGLALAINAAAVVMNALSYLMHCSVELTVVAAGQDDPHRCGRRARKAASEARCSKHGQRQR